MKPDKDLIIVGGGGAGLTAAQYGARAGLRTLVVEELALGGQALVAEELEGYPGFSEPVSGFVFAERFETQAKNFGAEFLTATVTSLRKDGEIFAVETTQGTLTSHTVILSTGAKHRTLDVPGEKELSGRGVSYCASCDGPFFRNQAMVVVGGGDAACDEAMVLAKLASRVLVIHRRGRFRAQKTLADRVLKNPVIETRFNTVVKGIEGAPGPQGIQRVAKVILEDLSTSRVYEEAVAAVFVFVGSVPSTGLVPQLEKDEAGYVVTDEQMATGVPGLFCAGDVRSTPFRQLVVAAGEGAIAANSAARYVDELLGQAY